MQSDHRGTIMSIDLQRNTKFYIKEDGTIEDEFGKLLYKTSVPIDPQQYARETLHETLQEKGLLIDEEWEMDDESIELTVLIGDS